MRCEYRLRASADIARVRASKRSWIHRLLVLYAAPNEVGVPRVGILVSRRIGKAALRNRTRRRIREAARSFLDSGGGRTVDMPAYDLLFIARGPSPTAEWTSLRSAVDELLSKALSEPQRIAKSEVP